MSRSAGSPPFGPRRRLSGAYGRLLAARKLGLTEVPTIELAHLTPAQRRAYILADNRLALDAGWDAELLRIAASSRPRASTWRSPASTRTRSVRC
jgi:hypothetical protein